MFRVCSNDPLLALVRDLFDATPLRIPDDRFRPLSVLGARRGRVRHYGHIAEAIGELPEVPESSRDLAELAGLRSRSTNVEFGCEILAGLVSALAGVPVPLKSLSAGFRRAGASSLAFQFPSPKRIFVSPLELGRALDGKKLENTPVTQSFLKGDSDLLLVDAVIVADQIRVIVDETAEFSPDLGLEPIGQVSYSYGSAGEVTLSSPRALPFGFSSFRVALGDDGSIIGAIDETKTDYRISGFASWSDSGEATLPYAALTESDELLEVD